MAGVGTLDAMTEHAGIKKPEGRACASPPLTFSAAATAAGTKILLARRAHPADRILVVDSAALVTGRMTAKVLVAGTIVHVDNRYLAVWGREGGAWRFVAYQATAIIKS